MDNVYIVVVERHKLGGGTYCHAVGLYDSRRAAELELDHVRGTCVNRRAIVPVPLNVGSIPWENDGEPNP